MRPPASFLSISLFLLFSVNIFAADTTAPGLPRGFEVAGGALPGEVVLTWTNPADSDLVNIEVYFSANAAYSAGSSSQLVSASPNTKGSANIFNLSAGTNYYFYIAALDSSGNRSAYTTELKRSSTTSSDQTSPDPVTNFSVQNLTTGGAIKLVWTTPANDDFFQVRIYRSTESNFSPSSENQIVVMFGLPSSLSSYNDTALTNNQTYYYKIRTEDNRGNIQSGLSYPSASATPTLVPVAPPLSPAETPQSEGGQPPAEPEGFIPSSSEGQPSLSHTDGDLLRSAIQPHVWIVKHAGSKLFRRHVLSASFDTYYPHLAPFWDNIKIVDDVTINVHNLSAWVRLAGDTKVYEVNDDGTKHWISCVDDSVPGQDCANEWTSSGRDSDGIYTVNESEFNAYVTGDTVILPDQPN